MNASLFTISNLLSFVRAPLAFVFLQTNPYWRMAAILLAMITDSIDGYVARKSRSTSQFGAILDPFMDKFFVYFALTVFFLEHRLSVFEMTCMLSRDISLILYGLFMLISGRVSQIVFRAIRWGKVATALQFLVLIALTIQFPIPWPIYTVFVIMGVFALIELYQSS